ncbi:putative receptor-like serine/threonine-protein kinase [Canna indica]|uniref:non-specific serine/threonine protein kinase n=1 Tax=Canna indica TaxID=4628 RepID=A0AAQ3JSH9_9LILI|nr:putative receptor-like serine/threonine-protein kinase [Canna indica]
MGAETQPSGGPLSARTPLIGLPLFVFLAISAAALLLFLFFFLRRLRSRASRVNRRSPSFIPTSIKEIATIIPSESGNGMEEAEKPAAVVEAAKPSEGSSSSSSSASSLSAEKEKAEKKMKNIGWGRWYTLAELEAATAAFSPANVIGEGGYGIVYRGVLPDLSVVAVKNLLNNKGQAEKEFKVEVEAIGKVRHKNLVGLLGYCAEGAKRMLVYEYIENGTLEQWLHGDVGPISPLTWDTRIKIAIGTAKGIAYLHEGLEPKVIHRDIKSSNILLDKHWNPKVSDFGLAKVLGSGSSYVTTRVMGTFGYVAPEYACTGMLNESSDVYSFGVLLMELISGRSPVDYSRPVGEVNMVEWFKRTVQSKREEEVVDPLIQVKPSPRALKRVMLICLRCTDMDAQKRPKMGQIIHMLEGDEFPFRIEHRSAREGTLTSYMSAKLAPPANSERSMW